MTTQSLPAVSLRTGYRLPAARVLLRVVNYLICMALWPIGPAISGLGSVFLPALREAAGSVDAEELRGGAAEDGDAVVVAQARDRQDVVDRHLVPRERVVGADHHLAHTALGDQVAHPFGGEHDRVEIELTVLQVLGRLLLGQRADPVREGRDDCIRARGVGRQEAAAMSRTNLEPRTKRSGVAAQNSPSFSFWILISSAAASRSARYQKGLMLSAAYSSLSDADLWGKIRACPGHLPWTLSS
jgi:hypothetical protein